MYSTLYQTDTIQYNKYNKAYLKSHIYKQTTLACEKRMSIYNANEMPGKHDEEWNRWIILYWNITFIHFKK